MPSQPIKIFLSGHSGIGKTTILKKVYENFKYVTIDGYIAQEIYNNDERIGFEIKNLQLGTSSLMAHKYKRLSDQYKVEEFSVNVDLLEKEFVPNLTKTTNAHNVTILCLDEIGRMQNLARNFINAVDIMLSSNKPLLATIVHDDEPWARKYKDSSKYYIITVTKENRDQLPVLIVAMLKQAELIATQSLEVQEKILYLFNLYINNNQIQELLKLFNHTIPYVANHAVEPTDDVNSYLVHGFHGKYIVNQYNQCYSCTCDFYSKIPEGKECSHIQTAWILESSPPLTAPKLKPTIVA